MEHIIPNKLPENFQRIPGTGGLLVKTFEIPPKGFDPLSASDQLLEQYGFPPRPDKNKNLGRYNHWKNSFATNITHIIPEFEYKGENRYRRLHGTPHNISQKLVRLYYNHEESTNIDPRWSGYVLNFDNSGGGLNPTPNSFGGFNWITGTWFIPALSIPKTLVPFANLESSTEFNTAAWVGIDGYQYTWPLNEYQLDLVQIGTEHIIDSSGVLTYSAWWQWGSWCAISNFPTINEGDKIVCSIGTSTYKIANLPFPTEPNPCATFYISLYTKSSNYTNQHSISFMVFGNNNLPEGQLPVPPVTGYSSEWILERTTWYGSGNEFDENVPDGSITFSDCYACLADLPSNQYNACEGTIIDPLTLDPFIKSPHINSIGVTMQVEINNTTYTLATPSAPDPSNYQSFTVNFGT